MKFQFSLANVLRATAWFCVSGGSYAFLASQWHEDRIHARNYPDWMWPWVVPSLYILIICCPFVGIGALFGQTKRGVIVGMAILFLWLSILAINMPHVRR